MKNEIILKPKYNCKICGYNWTPNKKGIASKPKSCANRQCRSKVWENGANNYKRYFQNPIECYYSKSGCIIAINHTRGKRRLYHKISRDGKQWLLHRWVFYIYNGYQPSVVMHTCDNTDCINPLHLVAGTQQENNLDILNKGRTAKGEKNSQAKLTTKDVIHIKKLLSKGESTRFISKLYNVDFMTIHFIKIGKNWKHIK